jgi:hypothetical protein
LVRGEQERVAEGQEVWVPTQLDTAFQCHWQQAVTLRVVDQVNR